MGKKLTCQFLPRGKNGPAWFFPEEKTDWGEIPACYTCKYIIFLPGPSLDGDLGEKVSLNWFTSYFELREKFQCIEHIGKSKIWTKISPKNPKNDEKLLPV